MTEHSVAGETTHVERKRELLDECAEALGYSAELHGEGYIFDIPRPCEWFAEWFVLSRSEKAGAMAAALRSLLAEVRSVME